MAITGRWTVTEFLVEGEWNTVEFGKNPEGEPVPNANAHFEPWIEIDEDMRGYPGGCNEFGIEYFIDGNVLSFGHTWLNLAVCGPMDLEDAFLTFLAAEEVARVDVEGESMTWSTSDASLRFVRGDSREENQ